LDVSWVGFERENKHVLINLIWGEDVKDILNILQIEKHFS